MLTPIPSPSGLEPSKNDSQNTRQAPTKCIQKLHKW
ncbi:MAG: hypothetical protein RLZZ165_1305 [Bacteroidota bacterium]|jgi:hypothetical protein